MHARRKSTAPSIPLISLSSPTATRRATQTRDSFASRRPVLSTGADSDNESQDALDFLEQDDPESDSAPLLRVHTLESGWKKLAHGPDPAQASRTFAIGTSQSGSFPSNAISNAKYNAVTFIPLTLFEQFKFFFNLYFLLVALSQFIPALRIGFLSTYIAPLAFVLFVTMLQEALDDLTRRRRDEEANSELYDVLGRDALVKARDLVVGDILKLHKDRRIPADAILLKTDDESGEVFVRTDQLDGETDWKLKVACAATQKLDGEQGLLSVQATCVAEAPIKAIDTFTGTLQTQSPTTQTVPLSVDNALWANTVLASGSTILAVVTYTGIETRQALNTSRTRVKAGLLEQEINTLSKILCVLTFLLSLALVAFHGFGKKWYVDIMRFLILFSTIIPISLRVNLDLGKNVYAHQIEHDTSIPDTVVRTSTIPEDLGRIEYLLTDKTGTLTKNDMEMKRLHVGTVSYAGEAMAELAEIVVNGKPTGRAENGNRSRRDIRSRVCHVVQALALCHNVTPTSDYDGGSSYQAASPDELAIVKWTATVGLTLIGRDRREIKLQSGDDTVLRFEVLHLFPFRSETKRMGIVVRDIATGEYCFYEKGADVVMTKIVAANDWLEEECGNMAREGLRTLVVGRKLLSPAVYESFLQAYNKASLVASDRNAAMDAVVKRHLEQNLELLGVTGVEDKLQDFVKPALEFLRNAGIKIWMLTGDKVETARCIAVSAKLVARGQYIHQIVKLNQSEQAMRELEFLEHKRDAALLIDGDSLQYFLDHARDAFIALATQLPGVICCRCSPTQKADVARLIRAATRKRVCCIGDGGNDVSMIQAADVGIGIVGKEGRQASLAADFSVLEFRSLMKLLVWHGRNSYKRSAKLAQFVIHRGLLISICQIVFSVVSKFAPIALYEGYLMVGYATLFTMAPVFSLALDTDLDESLALLYPELYRELTLGKSLSMTTFFVWVGVSIYQGVAIMLTTLLLQRGHDSRMVSISYTALIINELVMVALEVQTWVPMMVYAELATIVVYICSVPFLGDYFDLDFVKTPAFFWKTALVACVSLGPPWALKYVRRWLRPPDYAKVSGAA